MKSRLLVCAFFATMAAPLAAQNKARFDFFEYTGTDPIFQQTHATASQYYNPILPGFYPDPSMCRSGNDYYLVTSSFSYWPGIPVFHSRDLVHWKQIGSVLTRPEQASFDSIGMSRGVFAPSISCHAGKFYVINTLADAGGNFIATATNPAGPWSNPVWLHFDGIDPSLFFDDDGRVWIVNNGPPEGRPLYGGHRALWVQEYDPKAEKMIGPRALIVNGGVDITKHPVWIEAPHIFKFNGTYYLIAAEGGTGENHSEVVFRSNAVTGPWQPYDGNPILTQRQLKPDRPFPITSSGHADFVQTPKGDWWAVFLATRPYKDAIYYNTGRETFMLPVTWKEKDGWPHILEGDATIPFALTKPALPSVSQAGAMKTGNFTLRDDFTEKSLPLYWTFMRTVRTKWWDLSSKPGWLSIAARNQDIGKRAQPSFVGRRQQHAFATVTTSMRFVPKNDGDKAGLAAFQGDDNYYLLVLARVGGQNMVQLEQSMHDRTTKVLASAPFTGSSVRLKIAARGALYDFSYATPTGKWVALSKDVDGTFLSTRVAGGFVGVMLGMYAYSAQ